MGDDCIESANVPVDVLHKRYSALGHAVKQVKLAHSEDFEFCSHRFHDGKIYPVTPAKSVYRYLEGFLNEDQRNQLMDFCANSPEFAQISNVVTRFGMPRNDTKQETIPIQAQDAGPDVYGEGAEVERPPCFDE
jgi:hypothetical protein